MLAVASALDPILLELLDPHIQFSNALITVNGREFQSPLYDGPFDQHRVAYLLTVLLHIVRFGGLNFNKVISSTQISRSPCVQLIERITHSMFIVVRV